MHPYYTFARSKLPHEVIARLLFHEWKVLEHEAAAAAIAAGGDADGGDAEDAGAAEDDEDEPTGFG